MSEQNQAPSPEGVMHGPYPKTAEHPFDQVNGHYDAIDNAHISYEQAEALRDNLGQMVVDAYAEKAEIDDAEESQDRAYQEAYQPTEEELRQEYEAQLLSGEDLEEYEQGKRHGMYNN